MLYLCKTVISLTNKLKANIMYKSVYKNQNINIVKTIYDDGSVWWYFQINESNAEDHFFYKRTAIKSAKEIIDSTVREKQFPQIKFN